MAVTAAAAMDTTKTAYDGGADNSSKWQQWTTARMMGEHERRGRDNLLYLALAEMTIWREVWVRLCLFL